MKFKKMFDSEERKRRRIAKQALEEIRRLSDARYPLSLLFDRVGGSVEREADESWPQAYGRKLGLEVPQLHTFAQGVLDSGLYQTDEEGPPTTEGLRAYFSGWAVLLLTVEQELADAGSR